MEETCKIAIGATVAKRGVEYVGTFILGTHTEINKDRMWVANHSFNKLGRSYPQVFSQDIICKYDYKKGSLMWESY